MQVKNFHLRLQKEHLQEDEQKLNEFLQSVHVIKVAQKLVNINTLVYWAVLVYFEQKENVVERPKFDENTLSNEEFLRYELLRKWRADKASFEGYPAYMIFHNSQLAKIAIDCPTTIEAIAAIKGVGESRANRYGHEVLALLNC